LAETLIVVMVLRWLLHRKGVLWYSVFCPLAHKHIVKHIVVWVWRVERAVQEQTKNQELHPIYFRSMKIFSVKSVSL